MTVDASRDIFVANFASDQILEFAPSARGDVAPINRIALPSNSEPAGITITPAGHLLVSEFNVPAVAEYAQDNTGAWSLLHTLSGSATGIAGPVGVAVGPGGKTVVADEFAHAVFVFAGGADGNTAPMRRIAGPATGLTFPFAVAVDAAGTITVGDRSTNTLSIFRWGPGVTWRRLAPSAELRPDSPYGMALDAAGDFLVADAAGTLRDFRRSAFGNQAPSLPSVDRSPDSCSRWASPSPRACSVSASPRSRPATPQPSTTRP